MPIELLLLFFFTFAHAQMNILCIEKKIHGGCNLSMKFNEHLPIRVCKVLPCLCVFVCFGKVGGFSETSNSLCFCLNKASWLAKAHLRWISWGNILGIWPQAFEITFTGSKLDRSNISCKHFLNVARKHCIFYSLLSQSSCSKQCAIKMKSQASDSSTVRFRSWSKLSVIVHIPDLKMSLCLNVCISGVMVS